MMKITVLLGGDSPVRDVSLASGMGIVEALKKRSHDAEPLPLRRISARRLLPNCRTCRLMRLSIG